MDVRVKNYIASQEGWLSVTPGQHAIKYKDIGKAQATFSFKTSLYSRTKRLAKEPVVAVVLVCFV